MKRLVIAAILMLVCISAFADDWFPINAWGIKRDTDWVKEVNSPWNGNSSIIACGGGDALMHALLDTAQACNVKLIIGCLTTDSLWNAERLMITHMSRGQFSMFESEAHDSATWYYTGYFDLNSCIGDDTTDNQASNNTAWKAIHDTHNRGFIQKELHHHSGHRKEYLDYPGQDSLIYTARFYLKLPDTAGYAGSDSVCQLKVVKKSGGTETIDSLFLLVSDFTSSPSNYDTFDIVFAKHRSWGDEKDFDEQKAYTYGGIMDFQIYWYDTVDLYADKVEIWDQTYDSLRYERYNEEIRVITEEWDSCGAFAYYYTQDEPKRDNFEAFNFIRYRLNQLFAKPPITCVSAGYSGGWEPKTFSDFIKTAYGTDDIPLVTDIYPLDSAITTAAKIDTCFTKLCERLDDARECADTTGSGTEPIRDLWYVCQSHSWQPIVSGDTILKLRDPTPQEMWALVGLGLAHGAKGILYYRYKSLYYDNGEEYIHGLVDDSSGTWIHNSKWYATQDINAVLQKTDEFLLDFEFQDAFRGNDLQLQDFIRYVSLDSLSEFGLFRDSDNLNYFLIVNRTDDYDPADTSYQDTMDPRGDTTIVTLGLNGSVPSGQYYLRDCYSGKPYAFLTCTTAISNYFR